MAILELCGWIEESMDEIINNCAKKNLRTQDQIEKVKKDIIKKNHGFKYESNFKKMLIQLIGFINVCRLEKKVDAIKFDRLKSNLKDLKSFRDQEAHTYITQSFTRRIDAPSRTLSRLNDIYEGLKDYEKKLKGFKLKKIR